MVNFSKPNNPLIFVFLLSFLINNPHKHLIGPPLDMYKCIKYNLNNKPILEDNRYNLDEVKINVKIGSSKINEKNINLYYFPNYIEYKIILIKNIHNDRFNFKIKNNILTIKRIDMNCGWGYNHSIDIIIKSKESIYLFREQMPPGNNYVNAYVTYKSEKILDSRDENYYTNKGW
jgi:hypothetical protein